MKLNLQINAGNAMTTHNGLSGDPTSPAIRSTSGHFGGSGGPALPNNTSAPAALILPRLAFTLPELLVVISIIAILLGLLFSAIKTATNFSRRTITRSELINIEAAFKQYYAYYHCWPTNLTESVDYATPWRDGFDPNGDRQYEIRPQMARMLEGVAQTNNPTAIVNPDAVVFLELTRFDGYGAPVNAWGASSGKRYCVKVDSSGDNMLSLPTVVPTDSDIGTSNPSTNTNLFRSIGVWTIDPEKNKIIASWDQ